eukprot:3563649-Prymnesium_polylepis.1
MPKPGPMGSYMPNMGLGRMAATRTVQLWRGRVFQMRSSHHLLFSPHRNAERNVPICIPCEENRVRLVQSGVGVQRCSTADIVTRAEWDLCGADGGCRLRSNSSRKSDSRMKPSLPFSLVTKRFGLS